MAAKSGQALLQALPVPQVGQHAVKPEQSGRAAPLLAQASLGVPSWLAVRLLLPLLPQLAGLLLRLVVSLLRRLW
jgi:hypothetical protein